MGGIGSGGHNRRYVTAEACGRIDAGMLRRAGLFDAPKDIAAWKWEYSNRGRHRFDLLAYNEHGNLDTVLLAIVVEGWQYTQRIRLSWTACHYGQRRVWLHCPQCGRRCFRLYYYDNTWHNGQQVHFLACRICRRVTYELNQQRGFDRLQSQTLKVAQRIRPGQRADRWDEPPDKPKGMHWKTYSAQMVKWRQFMLQADESFTLRVLQHFPELMDGLGVASRPRSKAR